MKTTKELLIEWEKEARCEAIHKAVALIVRKLDKEKYYNDGYVVSADLIDWVSEVSYADVYEGSV